MRRYLITSFLLPLAIPLLVFSSCARDAGISWSRLPSLVLEQCMAGRQNLLVCGALGLAPVFLLYAGLWLHRRLGGGQAHRLYIAWSGLIPITVVLAWANFTFWPLYLPDRIYPGFPHGLELVIAPLIFAPVSVVAVTAMMWIMGRSMK